MKTLPTRRKQDAFEVGNVTTELLLPRGQCHGCSVSGDGMLDRGLGGEGRPGSGAQTGVPGGLLRRGGTVPSWPPPFWKADGVEL